MQHTFRALSVPRHPVWLRVTHGINALAVVALAVSGVAILLALPRLFWGEVGANAGPAWLDLPLPLNLEQTGWGRNLHFLAAWIFVLNGFIYLTLSSIGGRLWRRLVPDRDQVRPAAIRAEIRQHLRPTGEVAQRYNVLQKISYLVVVLVLSPVMLVSGLTMSPGVTTAVPELLALFGGRQSARTIHFLTACTLLLFLAVHVWQVLVNRPGRLLRGITIGGHVERDQ